MVIVNGKITDKDEVILDSGFNFGRGVFETILIKSEPMFLKQHLERLKNGLNVLKINNYVDEHYLLNILQQFEISNCVLKIIVTEKNIVISTRQSAYKDENYKRGFKLKLSNLRRNPYSYTTYLKSINYTDNILEKEQAAQEGFDEVIFLNTREELAEGSVSNVFFVKDNCIYTPSIECGILNGVVRDWIINNYDVIEGRFTTKDIENAEEVFITNSVMGVMQVSSFLDINYTNGPVGNFLRAEFNNIGK